MRDQNHKIATRIAINMCLALVPSTTLAGSYNSAGVDDSSVTLFVPQEHVWCQRLEAVIPLALQVHMNCGQPSTGIVRSAVATERTTRNRPPGLRSLVNSLRHTPIGHEPNHSDSDGNRRPQATAAINEGDPKTRPETNRQHNSRTKDRPKNKQAEKDVAKAKDQPSGGVKQIGK